MLIKISLAALLVCACTAAAAVPYPAVTDTFEGDAVGSEPAHWVISGDNGTTVTGNVESEAGGNQFLALRDHDTERLPDVTGLRNYSPTTTSGTLRFDIRFNEGFDAELNLRLYSGPYEPINLQWNSGGYSPTGDLAFHPRGGAYFTGDFPIGTWETIEVNFAAASSGATRGTYSVTWNGTTLTQDYLDQGAYDLAIDRFSIGYQGQSPLHESIDFDNVFFVPEPASAGLLALGGVALLRGRRRA